MMSYFKAPVLGLFLWALYASTWAASLPQRIVVLAPHAGELVCAAGGCDRIVGVVSYTDFPPQLKQLPKVGDYTKVNLEALLKLKPDLVIAWKSGTPKQLQKQLKALDLRVFYSNPVTLEDIPKEIKQLGDILGTNSQATRIAKILSQQLLALKRLPKPLPSPRVFYQLWDKPLMTVGKKQFISQAIHYCGGKNIFNEIALPAFSVSLETVIKKDPEIILLGGEQKFHTKWKQSWLQWPTITAVRKGNIFEVMPDLLQRPGPRLIAGTAHLCWLLSHAH